MKKKSSSASKRKKKEEFEYRIFLGFIFFNLIYFLFFEIKLIGTDIRYHIFILGIPIILGFIFSTKYNIFGVSWKEMFLEIKKRNNFFRSIYNLVLFFLGNIVFSCLTFGFLATIFWDSINVYQSSKNRIETYYLPVEEFHLKKGKGSNKIYFRFKNNLESIKVDYQTIKPYLDQQPKDYKIVLVVREGIWNHYALESWDLIKV
ncbi:hypothetical protein [Flavobacterium terrae]|uniref:Uncharacterized protein n=1 Tax=Flavobacterium terrae TaxID=415425 RepID=A0A1M6GVA0_9FLAO|nr:hypothetical protein [Flavobacterium terrae]SHJ13814.1 hypothetical protein SAMN05444363_2746 [Flavobacterium terrae]